MKMHYEDKDLEEMTYDELLVAAKHLRDRIRAGYDFLIIKKGFRGSRIRSTETGQLVKFSDFIEKSNLGAYISEYVKKAISSYAAKSGENIGK
jgi:hypothetical protein